MTPQADNNNNNNNNNTNEDLTLLFAGPITASSSFNLDAWGSSSCSNHQEQSNAKSMTSTNHCANYGSTELKPPSTWYHTDDDDDDEDDTQSWSDESFCSNNDNHMEEETKKEAILSSEEIRFDFRLTQTFGDTSCPCRVRFCSNIRIRHYEKSDPADWVHLYYSAHELQRMIDSHVHAAPSEEEPL